LFSQGRVALVSGQFGTRRIDILDSVGGTDRFDALVPVTQLALGMRCDTKRFRVKAGFEMTNWFNAFNALGAARPDFPSSLRSHSDMPLDVCTFRFGVAY
jgi:hypothetical protein